MKKFWSENRNNPCGLIKPFLRKGGILAHPYFFVEGDISGSAAMLKIHKGMDLVWDFYNMQFSSFAYTGNGITNSVKIVGASANASIGVATGTRKDIEEAWSGKTFNADISVSIPGLKDLISVGASGFVTADSSHHPHGPFVGIAAGASLSLGLSLLPFPAEVELSTNVLTISPKTNQALAKKLISKGIPLSMSGPDTCDGKCIRFDSQSKPATYKSRALSLVKSIPMLVLPKGASGRIRPNFEKLVLIGLAVGAYRDSANAAEKCTK